MVKQPVRTAAALLAFGLSSFGCDPVPEYSDEGQYVLDIHLGQPLGLHSHHALVGSTIELEVVDAIGGEVDEENGGGLLCAARSGSGVVVEIEDGVFVVEAAGEGAVELADPGIQCPANEDILAEFGPDRWSVIGTAPADAVARWGKFPDAYVHSYDLSPGPQGVFPEVLGRPIDDLRVVAGSQFFTQPALVKIIGDETVEVRWSDDDVVLTVPEHYDYLRPRSDDGVIFAELNGSLGAGEAFSASVTILGSSFPLPDVQAVPLDAIRSLELVPIYDRGDAQREWGRPAGLIAITRDGEGRRVIGAPVEFELTDGHLGVALIESDTLLLEDTCRRTPSAPTARTASITATLGELQASVDLEWVALPEDRHDPGDACVQACTCTSAPSGESTPGLLALFGLGVWLRRRNR